MKTIAVTGGSGGAGRYVLRDLTEHGYETLNLDLAPPPEEGGRHLQVDLTDYGQVAAALVGSHAVVHLGANPEPDFDFATGADRFRNNTLATYNVFAAAAALGLERVVWASSETVYGFPFDSVRPDAVPVTEDGPLKPQNGYALSKVACEELARRMTTLYGLPIVALRYSNILYTGTSHPANYRAIPSYWPDPTSRKFNLWGYIDARDAATAARLALEAEGVGAECLTIAAADTIMDRPNREVIEAVFPGTPIAAGTGDFETLLSIDKARRMLGFEPRYSWRDVLASESSRRLGLDEGGR